MIAALVASLALAAAPVEADIARALREVPPGARRAVAATRPLVGVPYAFSPLGEAGGRDPDPRFRLDAFDCMTFVETAIALASASSLDQARAALDDIRYRGAPSYVTRNHEVLSQWIPANVRKGWIVEETARIAGVSSHTVAKEYTRASWMAVRAAGRGIPGVPRARLPLGRFDVAIVAPEDVLPLSARVPDGSIVIVVRADAPDRPTRVTHAGLVVRGSRGVTLVRHATSSRGVGRVIEEPIDRFIRRQSRAYPRWPLEGFAFFRLLDASARTRVLADVAATGAGPPPAPPPPRL